MNRFFGKKHNFADLDHLLMLRFFGSLLFLLWCNMVSTDLCGAPLSLSQDSTASLPKPQRVVSPENRIKWLVQDSARFAREMEKQRLRDSIASAHDSLVFQYVRPLPANSPNLFMDSLLQVYTVPNGDFLAYAKRFTQNKEQFHQRGEPRHTRATWELCMLGVLLLLFGGISYFFRGELLAIVHALYSDRVVQQLSKEDNLFTSWAFVFLYILFGFTLGMFIFVASTVLQLPTDYSGVDLFFVFSAAVLILFTAKIVMIRFLGFIFDLKRLSRDYVSALYICYFNVAIVLLPILFAMVFLPVSVIKEALYLALIGVLVVLGFQFFRVAKNILTNYRFPKFYLFLYLCTLEISPILILLKFVGI
ncbi:DUF4271 domain-containing protein [Olivibacter sitiensis]|uniref:DUF4271 domain-containing protein n=1 Tax=Olivibacter sitiensis TaxID=376470 RepID=UPI0004821A5F|nr:DUF4271 domain-containing protein [Olivibacter sitiensis]